METCKMWGGLWGSPMGCGPRLRNPVLGAGMGGKIRFLQCATESAKSSGLSRVTVEPIFSNRLFILGMGFVGTFFAQELLNEGWVVSGTCKNLVKKKELEDRGFGAWIFDANEPELSVLDSMRDYTHLLVSIPPLSGTGDLVLQNEHLLRTVLEKGNLKWLCYLSSTSVYGDCGGAWVDEDYPPNPVSQKAKLRLDAEKGWFNLGQYLGVPTLIFRLGGIYGPGRSAVDTIIRKKPLSDAQIMRLSREYTSRVHVEDICQALKASVHLPSSRIYNVVDDDPASREEVFRYARYLVEERWPGQFQYNTSQTSAINTEEARGRGEKRVSNARLKMELGVKLLHPSYRSGLQSIIEQMNINFP